jgi:hypothetical protein
LQLLGQPGMQCLDQWLALLLAFRAPMLGGRAADVVLDGIELGNPPQCLLGQRRLGRDVDVVELAPHMRPAEGELRHIASFAGEQATESGIAIDLQQTAEPAQMRLRMLALAILTIDVGSGGMPRPAPGPVVHGIAPQPPGLGASAPRIEHWQRGVVSEYSGRGEHGAQHQLMQRRQPPTSAANPVAQRRTVQRHTLAGEDLGLAIQWQMIAEFVDQDLGEQSLGGHAAVDRARGRRCLHHGFLAGATSVTRPADHPDPDLGGNVVQHLGAIFADQMQCAAAAGTGLVLDIDHLLDARQLGRQCTAIAFGRLGA